MRNTLCWSWLFLLLIGCGAKYEASDKADKATNAEGLPALDDGEAGNAADAQPDDEKPTKRKIIYDGRISILVANYDEMESAIPALVKDFEGYIERSELDRAGGRRRFGQWVVRIPAERFQEFLLAVAELGIAEHQEQSATDVTMQYLDLEARIASKKKLEERIEGILAERAGKLSDQLEGEREISRVRSEIESMEGQLRLMKDRTDFSTVTINVREGNPAFSGRIGNAWQESIWSLKVTGQNFLIAAVAFVPWIIPLALFAWALRFLWKKIRRPKPVSD